MHPGVCAGSAVLVVHDIGSDSSVPVGHPGTLICPFWRYIESETVDLFTLSHNGSLLCAKVYIFRYKEQCSAKLLHCPTRLSLIATAFLQFPALFETSAF